MMIKYCLDIISSLRSVSANLGSIDYFCLEDYISDPFDCAIIYKHITFDDCLDYTQYSNKCTHYSLYVVL